MAEPRAQTRTVDRALELLVEVTDGNGLTLAEAARRVRLPASTALRLLRTLESHELVRRDDAGAFRPGRRLVTLAVISLRQENLVALSGPHLERLTQLTGESAYIAVQSADNQAVYLRNTESPHAIRHVSWAGHVIPLDGSAVGAALRGRVGPERFVAVRAGIEPDVSAVAAPIEVGGVVVAALSVLGPTYRIGDDDLVRFGRAVVEQAAEMTSRLGGAPTSTVSA